MNLDRDPAGKFMSRAEALSRWLPVLLNCAYYGPLSSLLDAAAKWCEQQAAREYRFAATVFDGSWTDPPARARRFAADAEKWFQRRAILLEAKKQIEEIR